jgi:hypothetical protein
MARVGPQRPRREERVKWRLTVLVRDSRKIKGTPVGKVEGQERLVHRNNIDGFG